MVWFSENSQLKEKLGQFANKTRIAGDELQSYGFLNETPLSKGQLAGFSLI